MDFVFYLAILGLFIAGVGDFPVVHAGPRSAHTVFEHSAALKSLDPAEVNDEEGADLLGEIYECLYNYKYGVMPYKIIPDLAVGDAGIFRGPARK